MVRLFPQTTCSCSWQSACYHVTAARISVGLADEPQSRRIYLTHLPRQQRKRPDKTAGRKRPRVNDVDVEPAGDIEPQSLRQLQTAVSVASSSQDNNDNNTSEATQDTQLCTDVCECDVCGSYDSPPCGKPARRTVVNWIGCDQCPCWFHNICLRVKMFRTATFA